MEALFQKAIDYYNSGYFFEAHDTFEELWIDEREEDKLFYQGLVQLSTGFYHFVMKNLKGTESQLSKSIEKLSNYEPEYEDIDITGLINQIKHFIRVIQSSAPDDIAYADLIDKIPKLHRRVCSNN